MTTQVLEHDGIIYRPESALRRGLRRLGSLASRHGAKAAVTGAAVVVGVLRAKTAPSAVLVRDHAFNIIGYGVFDSAMFVHSVFTGLMVTGISFLVFQWQVSSEGEDGTA